MTTNTLYLIIAVVSILFLISLVKNCSTVTETIRTDTVTQIRFTPPQLVHDTIRNIQYIPKFFEKDYHDTIYREGKPIAFTPEQYCKDNLEFKANSDTLITAKGDTANITFHYPKMIFDLGMKFKTDTTKFITNTITKQIKESPFGVFLTVGVVATADGNVRMGGSIGAGIRIY